ncbi:MAG: hypothetical protein FWF36_07405 [Propionibacteriaceae bacterium]|nr:hypothetical protein [Propionibacteriaceae bacterium]
MRAPSLVLLASGSTQSHVAQVVHTLRKRMQSMRPSLDIQLAFLGHCQPTCQQVGDILAETETEEAVFVPLDITRAHRASPEATEALEALRFQHPGMATRLARPLGPAAELLTVVDLRLRQALSACHADELDGLVFAVADSGDPRGNALIHRRARQWRAHHKLPVQLAYADGSGQNVKSAVNALRVQGRRSIAVGFFYLDADHIYTAQADMAREAGAIAVSAPLGDDVRLLDLAMARYSVAAMDLLDEATSSRTGIDLAPGTEILNGFVPIDD